MTTTKNATMTRNEKQVANAKEKTRKVEELIAIANNESAPIIERHIARQKLVMMINCNMHVLKYDENGDVKGGKIAGIPSIDGNAVNTPFCMAMRELAMRFPELQIICGDCYACSKRELMKSAAQIAHARNVLIFANIDFTEEELATLHIPCEIDRPYCRINEDGDFYNQLHVENIIKIMKTHKAIDFGVWYKNRKAVYGAFDKLGKPENCELVFSVPNISKDIESVKKLAGRHDDKVFVVFNTEEEVNAAIKAGFVKCNGVKCILCGFRCYKKADGVLFIAELKRKG